MHIINDNLLTISLIINRWMNQQRVKEEVDLKQDLCPAPSTARTHAHVHTHPPLRANLLTSRGAAAEWRGGGDGRGHWGSKASAAVARWRGHIPSRHGAGQSQRELWLDLLLQRLLLSAGSIRHESESGRDRLWITHLQSRRNYDC